MSASSFAYWGGALLRCSNFLLGDFMRSFLLAFSLLAANVASAATIDFGEFSGLTSRVWGNSFVSGGLEFRLRNSETWVYSEQEVSCMSMTSSGLQVFCGTLDITSVGPGTITPVSMSYTGSGPYAEGSNPYEIGLFNLSNVIQTTDFDPSVATCEEDGYLVNCSGPTWGEEEVVSFTQQIGGGFTFLLPNGDPLTGDNDFTLLDSGFVPVNNFKIHAAEITIIPAVVPLPAAVWLFGSALAGLGWVRRKQRA